MTTAPNDITESEADSALSDTALSLAADEVRQEMAAMPEPAELVPRHAALPGAR